VFTKRRRQRTRHVAVAIATIVAVAAACGSDADDATDTTAAAPSTEVSGATTSPSAAATTTTPSSEPISITFLPGNETLAMATQLQAFAKGYFEEEGLDVEYLPVLQNAAQVAQTVSAGEADIGSSGSTGAPALLAAGRDIVAIADLAKGSVTQLALRNETIEKLAAQGVTRDSPIADRVAALKGLSLSVPQAGSSTDILVRLTMEEYGIDPDRDVTLQPIADGSARVAAAREGQTDGYVVPPPGSMLAPAEGWGEVWISWSENDVPKFVGLPWTQIITSRAFLEENPEAVRRFLKALWRAASDLENDPQGAAAAIKERWFPDLDPTMYELAFDASLPAFTQGMVPDEKGFEMLMETYNASVAEPADLTFDQLYDITLVQETQP
jgi:NitT/TauT family transport system substrate-binding protein